MAHSKLDQLREVWKPVLGFEGRYEVSSLGGLRSLDMWKLNSIGRMRFHPGAVLSPCLYSSKYKMATFRGHAKQERRLLHAVVCEAFHGPRPSGHQVAHNNGNRLDNRAENLRWATPTENALDKEMHGTGNKGVKHAMAKLSEDDVRRIRSRCENGESAESIASDFPVTRHCVWRIHHRKTWGWLE